MTEGTNSAGLARDFATELSNAREAGDWAAHAVIWEERSLAEVDADEALLSDDEAEIAAYDIEMAAQADNALDAAHGFAPRFDTREGWLNAFTAAARPAFKIAGSPIPRNVRMAVGFCSTGRRGRRIGECWGDTASRDGTFEIFIVPSLDDAEEVAGVLTHELIHAAVGLEVKHGPQFKKVALALGLGGKMTATVVTDKWRAWASEILADLGPLPHARLASGVSSGPKQQTGRNLKVECDTCGFTFRTAQKWLDAADTLRCPDADCDGTCISEGR